MSSKSGQVIVSSKSDQVIVSSKSGQVIVSSKSGQVIVSSFITTAFGVGKLEDVDQIQETLPVAHSEL